MTYHPSFLKNKTRERNIEATSTKYDWTEREKLVIEKKTLKMVLNGNPPAELRKISEKRLIEISLELGALTEEEALRLTRNVLRAIALNRLCRGKEIS